jgi:hypothetical protein
VTTVLKKNHLKSKCYDLPIIYIFSESVEERRWLVLSAPGPRHIHTKRCIIRSISSLNTADSRASCGVGAGNGVVEKIISNFKLLSQAISVIKILKQKKSFLVCYPKVKTRNNVKRSCTLLHQYGNKEQGSFFCHGPQFSYF